MSLKTSNIKASRQAAMWTILFISNLFRMSQLRACRFHPSCSAYSTQAFRDFGFFRAFFMMVRRLCKCHPFSPGGYDPLPSAQKEGF